MVTITISDELKSRVPGLALGCVTAEVPSVAEHDEGWWREIDSHLARLTAAYKVADIPALPQVAAMRAAYKALGKEPSRYRGSAEALLRRVLSGKAVYQINNIVDVNNLVSLESFQPLGAYESRSSASADSAPYRCAGRDLQRHWQGFDQHREPAGFR